MNRRTFIKSVAITSLASGLGASLAAAERYFPTKVDQTLFENVNRVKDPAKKSSLEKSHAPVISAPAAVKAGEPFVVEVAVGEVLHPMGTTHWIEYIEVSVGNEPAGRVDFQAKGFMRPKCSFTLVIPNEAATAGRITLVAAQRCNLHGYWETSADIVVT